MPNLLSQILTHGGTKIGQGREQLNHEKFGKKELIKCDEMTLTINHNVAVKMQFHAKSWSKHSLVEHSTLFMTLAAQFRDQPFSAADQESNPGTPEYER